ncbi:MAG: hypothetical protein K0Q95_1322 [Bacteroidota bacterium]|jgi:hypothetical protein|nr:hypothetical protein [Bacteroidota bacterium]
MQKTDYPQYRKYHNGKAYFKIVSETQWEEVLVMGSKCIFHEFSVKIMPDRNYIHDMTFDYEKSWEKIDEKEYEEIKGRVT